MLWITGDKGLNTRDKLICAGVLHLPLWILWTAR
jgi:hypothetical protein